MGKDTAPTPRRKLARIRLIAVAFTLIMGIVMLSSAGASASVSSQMVGLVNSARANGGLPALEHHDGLASVAQSWASHMAEAKRLSHNPSTGAQIPSGWSSWAENVAFVSSPSANKLHRSFMDSPPHRANIMGSYTHIGVGYAQSSDGTGWVVEVFAKYPGTQTPAPSPSPSKSPESPSPTKSPSGTAVPPERPLGPVEKEGTAEVDSTRKVPEGWLGQGSHGAEVKRAQELLISAGYTQSVADGHFGPRTTAAVISFQADAGLVQDGLIGPITFSELNKQNDDPPEGGKKPRDEKSKDDSERDEPESPEPAEVEDSRPDDEDEHVNVVGGGTSPPPSSSMELAPLLVSTALAIVAVNVAGFLLVSRNRRAQSRRRLHREYTAALHELGLG